MVINLCPKSNRNKNSIARLIWYPNRAIYNYIYTHRLRLTLQKSLSVSFSESSLLFASSYAYWLSNMSLLRNHSVIDHTNFLVWQQSQSSSNHLRRRCWMSSPSNFNCVVYGKWSSTKVTVLNHTLPSKIHFVKGYPPGCPKKIRRCCVTMVIASVCITTWASQRHIIVLCYKK